MPRDLAALKEDTLQGMPQLTKTPEEVVDDGDEDGRPPSAPMDAQDEARMFRSLMKRHNTAGGGGGMNSKRDEIHPYTQTLSLSDIESCILLEEATFPPEERCTREKVRLCSSSILLLHLLLRRQCLVPRFLRYALAFHTASSVFRNSIRNKVGMCRFKQQST